MLKYFVKVHKRNGKHLSWSNKSSGEVLNKLKSKGYLCTYDFSTLYTTLLLNPIKEKLTGLIEHTLNREDYLHLACNEPRLFHHKTSKKIKSMVKFEYLRRSPLYLRYHLLELAIYCRF